MALVCSVTAGGVPAQAKEPTELPQPVYVDQHFGDPAVAKTAKGYVAVATGALVRRAWSRNGKRWTTIEPALERLPTWAAGNRGDIWAPEIARVKGRWVLYFSAPVKGLTATGRCIGVATAKSATSTFVPDDRAPLVCPPKGRTPPAGNQVPDRDGLPRHGVIDPSSYVDERGRAFVLYKTDGIPSTIRVLPLRRNGLAPKKNATSREILRSAGVVENPVLMRRQGLLHLFTSEGDYTRCDYRTTWRTATTLDDLATATPGVLADRRHTGLCGPAGADVVKVGKRAEAFLHAWACAGGSKPCGRRFTTAQTRQKRAVRAMYAVRLRFDTHVPELARWRN